MFFQIFVLAGPNGNMRKSFTAVARVARVHFFFSLYRGVLRVSACIVCTCVCVRTRADGRRSEEERERTASRVPKASTFCYAIARSWRRDSIKRRMRHHGRPINPQTKVDYDFSRGHRSRLLLRPVHTHERVHRFFGATCTLDEFEYRTGRRELLRPAPPVHREISFPLVAFFYIFFYFHTRTKYQCEPFATDEISTLTSLILLSFFFFLVMHLHLPPNKRKHAARVSIYFQIFIAYYMFATHLKLGRYSI